MLKHLQPLPISEEMLGAYLEGNLTADEVGYVESCLQANDGLRELVEDIDVGFENMDEVQTDIAFLEFGQDVLSFQLPELPSVTDLDGSNMFVESRIGYGNTYDMDDSSNMDSIFDDGMCNL